MSRVRVPPPNGVAWPHVAQWGDGEWAAWLRGQGEDEAAIQRYLQLRAGLSLRIRHAKTNQVTTVYSPTPKGVAFHTDARANLLFGGAAGGAKSYTARHDAYLRLLTVPGARLLLLRRKYTELVDNHLNDASRECARMADLGLPIRYIKDDRRVVYDHGKGNPQSWLRFGHCEHEGDEDQYLSSEYETVYIDEAATFTKKQVMGVASRLRSSLPGVTPLLRCTSNPGGAQTLWLKTWFMDHAVPVEEDPTYRPQEWGFLGSRLYDNPYLMDPDGTWRTYEKRLSSLGPERARQMLEGDWDLIAGQFFSEWRRTAHVADLGVIGPDVQRFRCLDWGYNAPFACYWIACLPDGRLYVEHEWVERQIIAADVAAGIVARTRQLYGRAGGAFETRYTVADPSMWNKTGQTGESIAETFARHGVPLKKGNNDREVGWQRLRHWLAPLADGQPGLQVHPSCAYLIRTLPALVSDEHKPEDVDTTGEDHGADAVRYGVMSRPSPTQLLAVKRLPPEGSIGQIIASDHARARRAVLGHAHVRA